MPQTEQRVDVYGLCLCWLNVGLSAMAILVLLQSKSAFLAINFFMALLGFAIAIHAIRRNSTSLLIFGLGSPVLTATRSFLVETSSNPLWLVSLFDPLAFIAQFIVLIVWAAALSGALLNHDDSLAIHESTKPRFRISDLMILTLIVALGAMFFRFVKDMSTVRWYLIYSACVYAISTGLIAAFIANNRPVLPVDPHERHPD